MVKISNKALIAGALATAISIPACQKYEDGPAISLLTKTQRLTGDWEVTKFKFSSVNNIMVSGDLISGFSLNSDGTSSYLSYILSK